MNRGNVRIAGVCHGEAWDHCHQCRRWWHHRRTRLACKPNLGIIASAAVDVRCDEPPQSDCLKEFITNERMVVIPHPGANTIEYRCMCR